MLDFFNNNIFIHFSGLVFQQTIGIPMGTNCGQLFTDLFLHAYKADFIEVLLKNKTKKIRPKL